MGVNDRVLAIELDGRLAACAHAAEDTALAIPIDVAFVLLNLDELRRLLDPKSLTEGGIKGAGS